MGNDALANKLYRKKQGRLGPNAEIGKRGGNRKRRTEKEEEKRRQ